MFERRLRILRGWISHHQCTAGADRFSTRQLRAEIHPGLVSCPAIHPTTRIGTFRIFIVESLEMSEQAATLRELVIAEYAAKFSSDAALEFN